MVLIILLEKPAQHLSLTLKSKHNLLRLAFEGLFVCVAFAGMMAVWAGLWVLLQNNIFPDPSPDCLSENGAWTCLVIGFMGTLLLQGGSSNVGMDTFVDGEADWEGIASDLCYFQMRFGLTQVPKYECVNNVKSTSAEETESTCSRITPMIYMISNTNLQHHTSV